MQRRSRRRRRRPRIAQQVIGAIERDEALRVAGHLEETACVLDADGLVDGRVEDEQRLAEIRHGGLQRRGRQILEELPADPERPAGERDQRLAARGDLLALVREELRHVAWIRRRADRRDGNGPGIAVPPPGPPRRRGCGRRASPAPRARGEEVRGADQVLDVGGEGRVGEVAVAAAESREVEPQHGHRSQPVRAIRGSPRRPCRT